MLNKDLQKGKITAVLVIETVMDSLGKPITSIQAKSTTASANTLGSFMPMLDYLRLKIETDKPGALQSSIRIEKPEVKEVLSLIHI